MKKSLLMVVYFGLVALLWSCGSSSDSGGSDGTLNGSWIRVAEHAEFSLRDTADGFIFLGKMWISNGYRSDGLCDRDLWSSEDGIRWTRVLNETPYDQYSEIVVYNGRLWAISQSVWSSENGVDWVRILDSTPFAEYWSGKVVVHDGKMWHLGHDASVWWSIDGVNWTRAIGKAPFGNRGAPAVEVFAGKLWVMGGSRPSAEGDLNKHVERYAGIEMSNDVWSSTDGENWTLVTAHAPWKGRMWFPAQAYADRLWIMGGYDNDSYTNLSDVWYTTDGVNWKEFSSETVWSARHEQTTLVYNDSLWVIAGNSWPVMNDVWRLTATTDQK